MKSTSKNYLINHKIIDQNGKVLPITQKNATIFFISLDSNQLFKDFYSSYPEEAIKSLPTILSVGFHASKKAFKSFTRSLFNYIDISSINYTFEELDLVEKKSMRDTSIKNIFYAHGNIQFSQKNIHQDFKNDLLSSFLFRDLSIEDISYSKINMFLLKILSPYLSVKHPKKFKEVFEANLTNFLSNNIILPSPISSLQSFSNEFYNLKLSHFLEIQNNPQYIFESSRNQPYIKYVTPILNDFNHNQDNGFLLNKKKFHDYYINTFNQQELLHWVYKKNNTYYCPEFYLFNKKYNSEIEKHFKHDISLDQPNQFNSSRHLIKTMVAINHSLLNNLIEKNKITGKHLNDITNKLLDSIESDKIYSFFIEPYNLSRQNSIVIYFNDYLENFLFNLDKLFQKHPHLLNDFKINTNFLSYNNSSLNPLKSLDLFLLRSKSLINFVSKYEIYFNNSVKNILDFTNYKPPLVDEVICSNLFLNKHLNILNNDNTLYLNIDKYYYHLLEIKPLTHPDLSNEVKHIKHLANSQPNELVNLFYKKSLEDEGLNINTHELKLLRTILLRNTPKYHGISYYQLLEELKPELIYNHKYTEEDIYNIGIKGLTNEAALFNPTNQAFQNVTQELRKIYLTHYLSQTNKNDIFVKNKKKI